MFVCKECLIKDEVKVVNKEWAIMTIEAMRGSYGPCECCKKTALCADV